MKEPFPSYSFAYEPIGHEPGFDPYIIVGKRTLTRLMPPHRERRATASAPASATTPARDERPEPEQDSDGTRAPVDDPFWFAEGTERQPTGALADRGARLAGQMDKDRFLAELRAAVEEVATRVLGPTWSLARCPDIPRFFERQAAMPAARVEALMRRYTRTETADARGYIEAVRTKLPSALRRWASSQDPSLTWEPGASGLPLVLERDDTPADGAARYTDPAQWGSGAALDDETRARMESRLGDTLGDVQLHTSGALSDLATASGKDAVAVGRHVGFAPGAHEPGTPTGEALLAHELAHLIQQRNAATPDDRPVPMASDRAHEDDADRAAAEGGRPSLRSPVIVRGGNKPEGPPPQRDIRRQPAEPSSNPSSSSPTIRAPIQIQAIDPRLHVSQLRDLFEQFCRKSKPSDFSEALYKLIAIAPEDDLVDSVCWNGLIDLLIEKADAFQREQFLKKKPQKTSTTETYASRRANDVEIQLCLELICALGSKNPPRGGKAVPYGKVIPILYNASGINTGTKDPQSKTDEFLFLPLDQVRCPFLDSDNYLFDLEVLTTHFERTRTMLKPGFTPKLFCEEDQIRLLRFPRIHGFFQQKLQSLRTSKVCPSAPVLQCILDIGGALTGGNVSPTQHKATLSPYAQHKLGKARTKRSRDGEEMYGARRMRVMHTKRAELLHLLETTCKQDAWVLDTKYYVISDLKRFWATIDEVIAEAMIPTDSLGFSGTCQGGMGSSTIDWCLSMMEKRDTSGNTIDDREYVQLTYLFEKANQSDGCIHMFEIKLPTGMSTDDLETDEPDPIVIEPDRSFDTIVKRKGIQLSLFSKAFQLGKNPNIQPSPDVIFECATGGSYYLKALTTGGASWAAEEYTFELVGAETDEKKDEQKGEEPNNTNMSPVDTIAALLQRDDIEQACAMLVEYDGVAWGMCASKLVTKVYETPALYRVVLAACDKLSVERLTELVDSFVFMITGEDNEKALRSALIAALKELGLYTSPIHKVLFPPDHY